MGGHDESRWSDAGRLDYNKLFDDKLASTEAFKYGGEGGAAGETWRNAVLGYVGTKARIIITVLDWAEAQDDTEITGAMVSEMIRGGVWLTEIDIFSVSEVFWGFLNI